MAWYAVFLLVPLDFAYLLMVISTKASAEKRVRTIRGCLCYRYGEAIRTGGRAACPSCGHAATGAERARIERIIADGGH